jgi:hypothetical protein
MSINLLLKSIISFHITAFGITEFSKALIVAIFDDIKGKKMVEAAKRIKETPIPLEQLTSQRNSR